jgi:hypothetical protein
MFYIIQENTFRERHYQILIESLDKWNLPYEIVRIFPFSDKILAVKDIPDIQYNLDDIPDFIPPTKNVFLFGAIKLSRICRERGWNPGSFLNDNHDFEVYSKHYGDNLLNYDSKVIRVGDVIKWGDNELKFIRPTKDTKIFTGKVFTEKEWLERKEYNLLNFNIDNFNEDTLIKVSTPKKIYKEIRCWVVDGSVITASTYKIGESVIYSRQMVDLEAIEFAQKMVDKFKLADAFVIDVCLTSNGWRIVECGCINSCGFYDSDLSLLIDSVERVFNTDYRV